MRPARTIEEILRFLMERRGYIVFGSKLDYPIGSVLENILATTWTEELPYKTVVIATTDAADYNAQAELVDRDASHCPVMPYYYRLIAE